MKRLFDIISALLGLVFLSPLLIILAIGVKLSSPGMILYRQQRIGLEARPFYLYKFRSMVANADRMGSSVTTAVDRRITPFGRFLRGYKLDELPQLWNVLIGEMSLVGPRPDVAEIVDQYTDDQLAILDVRPGITSIASLHMRNEEGLLALFPDPDDAYIKYVVPAKIELALEHVRRDSFWFDLKILLLTLWAVVPFGARIYAIPEHPVVADLRKKAQQLSAAPKETPLPVVEAEHAAAPVTA